MTFEEMRQQYLIQRDARLAKELATQKKELKRLKDLGFSYAILDKAIFNYGFGADSRTFVRRGFNTVDDILGNISGEIIKLC